MRRGSVTRCFRMMHDLCALPLPCGRCGPPLVSRTGQSSHSCWPSESQRGPAHSVALLQPAHQHATHTGASNEHRGWLEHAGTHPHPYELTLVDLHLRICRGRFTTLWDMRKRTAGALLPGSVRTRPTLHPPPGSGTLLSLLHLVLQHEE